MRWYKTGTINVTNGSKVVNGTSTDFIKFTLGGEALIGPDGNHYEIDRVVSATELRIVTDYAGPTATAQPYRIVPVQGYVRDLAIRAAGIIDTGTQAAADAQAAAVSATASQTAAQNAATAAQASATSATTSASGAANSATSATASATTATTKAAEAATAATTATSAAATATTKASEASTSASNALTSANAAASSEANALASRNAASTSATNASASATSASTSATTATTKASEASLSAANASSSASSASTQAASASASATTATTKASEASASATSAANSSTSATAARDKAQLWAEAGQGVQVETGKYSAKHWALQAQATATGALVYRGAWSASSGVYPSAPALGDYYRVSVGGVVATIQYNPGDSIIYNGSGWDLIDSTESVTSVAGRVGAVTLTPSDVGLGNVNNTSDLAKPISTAAQTALNGKEGTIAAGTTTQYWRGDKTWRDFFADVRAATLAGIATASDVAIEAADTVLGALAKLQAQITGHKSAATGAHAASAISNAPAGNIASTTVQAAINELDAEKQATLVSNGNIKTIFGATVLGPGNIAPPAHSALSGLGADDHPHYLNTTRGDARYPQLAHTHTATSISDSSAIGRTVLTAADAAAVRSAIGAGTGDVATTGDQSIAGVKTMTDRTVLRVASFASEHNAGNSGTAVTVNFTNGQKQRLTLTGNATVTLAFPGVGNYQITLVQDATGNRTVTWSGVSKYVGSATAPGINTAANSETIVSIYWNGTSAWLGASKVNA